MNSSLLIIERPGSFRDALVSEIELSGARPHVRDDGMEALAMLRELRPKLVLVSEDPGPPGASSLCRLVRRSVEGAAVYRLGDPGQRDALDDQTEFVPRAVGATAIARFLVQRAENDAELLAPQCAWDAPVASLELGPLLMAVAQRGLTGRLVLSAQGWERELSFARGFVVASRSSVFGERLGQVALRAGLLSQAQLDRAVDQARSGQRRLGEVLLDVGSFDGAKLFSALCAQQLEHVVAACNNGACHARFVLDEGVIGEQLALRLHPLTALLHAVQRTPKEDVARVLDQLADRNLTADTAPDLARDWLAAAGADDAPALLRSVTSVRSLREKLSKHEAGDAIALALLRAGACKLPGRASLIPSDVRPGMSTLSPPSVVSAVVRCARASFDNWPVTALQQPRTPLEQALDAYLTGSRSAEQAKAAALKGPVSELGQLDLELLTPALRAAGSEQRTPGAWLPVPAGAPARELRSACHAALTQVDARELDASRPLERLRSAELRRWLERALRVLDAPSASQPMAASPIAEAKPVAAVAPKTALTHAGDPVLLSQVEPLVQQARWQELRTLLTNQDAEPANLPPA
ncbi:MAG TPA: DUF4388 domain-containing protein, partial [Polyangiales bacterium]|nr:DUF4388 domain-containing protein [Polyangiales bacterium]